MTNRHTTPYNEQQSASAVQSSTMMMYSESCRMLLAAPVGEFDDLREVDHDILSDGSASIFSDDAVKSGQNNRTPCSYQYGNDHSQGKAVYTETVPLQMQQQQDRVSPLTTQMSSGSSSNPPDTSEWRDWDVPLGRCQEVREFVGNIRFRGLIEQHRPAYLKAERKTDKTSISAVIFKLISANGGRFLDRKKGSTQWFEISQEKAMAKISQSLRNGTRPVRKHMVPVAAAKRVVVEDNNNSRSDNLSGMCITVPNESSSAPQLKSQISDIYMEDEFLQQPSSYAAAPAQPQQQRTDEQSEADDFLAIVHAL